MSGTGYYPAPSSADETFLPPQKRDGAAAVSKSAAKSDAAAEPKSVEKEGKPRANLSRAAAKRRSGPLHFIGQTIRKQGTTLAVCARRLGVSLDEARSQADGRSDITLSQLFAWREILDVPLSELVPFVGVVPDPIRNRALLLRIMKTARQLQEASCDGRLESISTSLVDQLLELAPEFESVPPWPAIGQSHAPREDGASIRRVDSDFSKFLEERS